jgi:hypothetical protein
MKNQKDVRKRTLPLNKGGKAPKKQVEDVL